MLLWKTGIVSDEIHQSPDKQVLIVEVASGKHRKAINYPILTGVVKNGDTVALNTTAVALGLGTGGYDFVIANLSNLPVERPFPAGHIIKNRYTPIQFPVRCGEEDNHPNHPPEFNGQIQLDSIPVCILGLHSMLPILALAIHYWHKELRMVYVMSDSASLPIWLSNHVEALKSKGILTSTITYGQAFGGDLEAINKFSALLLAKSAYNADIIIIGPGPGSVGTGSTWGYSSIEVGEMINAVNILKGTPIVIPRISFLDRRKRHQGISHHLVTALSRVALTSAHLVVPHYNDERSHTIETQIQTLNPHGLHLIHSRPFLSNDIIEAILQNYTIPVTTMGRDYREEEDFFQGVMLSARFLTDDLFHL